MAFVPPTPSIAADGRVTTLRATSFVTPLASHHTIRVYSLSKSRPVHPQDDSRAHGWTMQMVDVKKHDVFMPALSSTMTEGRIVQWLKQPGDAVKAGEPVMVVESDKADMDVEAFESGYLASILVEEGDSCDVGVAVGYIVENREDVEKLKNVSPPPQQPIVPDSSPSNTSAASSPPAAPPAPSTPAPAVSKPDMNEVFMPALSSTMIEGKIVEWLKSEGDKVDTGEMVMVVESDKADMDVESFESGYLAHVIVDAGESCPVGEPVAYIAKTEPEIDAVKAWAVSQNTSASAPATHETPAQASKPPTPPPASKEAVQVPTTASVVNEGRIVASPLAKVTAKKEGIDLRYVKGTGPNGRIVEADVLAAKSAPGPAPTAPVSPAAQAGKVVATPDAKKVAKKEKIDLSTVAGTGNFGRITADDVLKAAGKLPEASSTKAPSRESDVVAPKKTETGKPVEVPAGAVSMNAMQKAVVQNMNASLDVPVFRITYKIKTAALDDMYAKVKPKGVTMSALLAKAVGITLTKHPIMNAAYAKNSIVYRPEINVAMAVALKDGGLITPTLKDADKIDLYSLSRSWKDLVKRALEKKLSPDEYNSGTFFISNLGMFGVEQFDAILPPGAPGILAIGAAKPVVGMQSNGMIGMEKEMCVTLTADHRHIYGADGAKFLKDLAELIENNITELVM